MNKYVGFLRAVNVGGHAIVRMNDLASALSAVGCEGVKTYGHAGNVIFTCSQKQASSVFRDIKRAIGGLLGGEPTIVIRTIEELDRLVKAKPFKAVRDRDAKLYVTFLSMAPEKKPSLPLVSSKEALRTVAMKNLDVFIVSRQKKNGFYGFPNNFIEKELGVSATTRNWSTVTKIVDLASG